MFTICQLLHSLNIGGAEVLAAALGERMASAEFRFVYFCLDEEGEMASRLRENGFSVECLHRAPGRDRNCMRRIADLWKKHDVKLVQAHQYTPFFYALSARGFFEKTPPILFTEHGRFFPDLPNWKHKIFNRLRLGRRDRVVAVGESVKEALVRNEGISRGRIQVIYNGISPERFAKTPERVAAAESLRKSLGVPAWAKIFVHIARLDTIKDHFTSMRAVQEFHRLASEHPEHARTTEASRLWIVGGGPEEASLRRFITQNSLENRVQMLGPRRDIPEILAAADAFLLTSLSEGIPVTILEALAAGVPVISTDVGGVREILTDETTGLLAPAGDAAKLGRALFRVAFQPGLSETLSRNATNRLLETFTEEKMHAEYEKLFREMR